MLGLLQSSIVNFLLVSSLVYVCLAKLPSTCLFVFVLCLSGRGEPSSCPRPMRGSWSRAPLLWYRSWQKIQFIPMHIVMRRLCRLYLGDIEINLSGRLRWHFLSPNNWILNLSTVSNLLYMSNWNMLLPWSLLSNKSRHVLWYYVHKKHYFCLTNGWAGFAITKDVRMCWLTKIIRVSTYVNKRLLTYEWSLRPCIYYAIQTIGADGVEINWC